MSPQFLAAWSRPGVSATLDMSTLTITSTGSGNPNNGVIKFVYNGGDIVAIYKNGSSTLPRSLRGVDVLVQYHGPPDYQRVTIGSFNTSTGSIVDVDAPSAPEIHETSEEIFNGSSEPQKLIISITREDGTSSIEEVIIPPSSSYIVTTREDQPFTVRYYFPDSDAASGNGGSAVGGNSGLTPVDTSTSRQVSDDANHPTLPQSSSPGSTNGVKIKYNPDLNVQRPDYDDTASPVDPAKPDDTAPIVATLDRIDTNNKTSAEALLEQQRIQFNADKSNTNRIVDSLESLESAQSDGDYDQYFTEIINNQRTQIDAAAELASEEEGNEGALGKLSKFLDERGEGPDSEAKIASNVGSARSIAESSAASSSAALASSLSDLPNYSASAPTGGSSFSPVSTVPLLGALRFDPSIVFPQIDSFARWANGLILWASTIFFLRWFYSDLSASVQSLSRTPVQATSGGGAFGAVASGKRLAISILFVAVVVTAVVVLVTTLRAPILPLQSLISNSLSVSAGAPAAVGSGLSYMANFIPMDHLVGLFVLAILIRKIQIPAIFGVMVLIRLFTI